MQRLRCHAGSVGEIFVDIDDVLINCRLVASYTASCTLLVVSLPHHTTTQPPAASLQCVHNLTPLLCGTATMLVQGSHSILKMKFPGFPLTWPAWLHCSLIMLFNINASTVSRDRRPVLDHFSFLRSLHHVIQDGGQETEMVQNRPSIPTTVCVLWHVWLHEYDNYRSYVVM